MHIYVTVKIRDGVKSFDDGDVIVFVMSVKAKI